jgi:hypothetical protein
MRNDLGIGLGNELMIQLSQALLQLQVVFDDAVVNDYDPAGAVPVWMSILFSGAAVRGPASVTYTVGPIQRAESDGLFQIAQLAFSAANLKVVILGNNGDAS